MKHLYRQSRHRRWLLPAVGMLVLLPLIAVGMIRAGSAHTANTPTVVSIQFDDGYSDQYQALPMLSAHNMHATFFINSGSPGQANYMTWSQLHDLTSAGNEIGGHTVSHVNLGQVSTDEATRQVCNDRINLTNQGFTVTDFAYPYGANNASVQSVVQGCGYNSARDVKGLVSPSGCSGCPYAETIPPANYYDTRTSDNITSSMSLATIEGEVTQAQQNGGGWTQLVFHHVCNGCDIYAITPANLSALLDWLQQQQSNNTTIQTVNQVIGGPVQPAITGPPPPANQPLQNPSLETDTSPADGVPDCWSTGSTGTNTASFTRTADAHTGSSAERVDVSNYSSGDAKLVTQQDLGQCAYSITSGQSYQLSEWYKGTGQIAFVVYTRNPVGGWTFCRQSPFFEAASSTWTQAIYNWSQPATSASCGVNIGYTPTAISFGLALSSNGSLTTDDAAIASAATDTTAPSTTISCNSAACGSSAYPGVATITLNTTDNSGGSGVYETIYTTDNSTPGAANGIVYTGQFPLTKTTKVIYRSVDYAGNFEASHAQTVNVTADTTPPTSTISCSGSPCSNWFGPSGTNVTLSATDNSGGSGVKAIYYTTDGSDPTTSSPTYTAPFPVTSTTTVKFRAVDNAGNLENANTQLVQVDATAPLTSISCNGTACNTLYTAAPVTVTLTSTDAGSGVQAIYYTTDGTDPTTSSPTYTGPLTISTPTTLKYRAADNAGNLEQANTQAIQIDTAEPTSSISCGGSCSSWFGAAGATVTLSASDDNGGSGVANIYYTTDGSDPTTSSTTYQGSFTVNSTETVKFRAQDVAGNLEQVNSQSIQVDANAPTSSIKCDGGPCAGWFGAAGTTVTLNGGDTGGSGLAAIYYTTDGTTPDTNSLIYSGAFPLTSTATVKFRAQDVAGNLEAVNSQTVQVDSTAPTTSASCNGSACGSSSATAPVNVTLSATDRGSGVQAIYYTTDGTDPTTSSAVYTSPFVIGSNATLKFRAVDNAGNLEQVNTQVIEFDLSAPTSSISCNLAICSNGWYTTSAVTVSLSATDNQGGSGVKAIYYTTDGSDPTTSSTAYTAPFSVSSTRTVKFRSQDVAGNLEAVNSRLIQVDTTPPTTTALCNNASCSTWFAGNVALTLSASDNQGGSGVSVTRYTLDGSTPSTTSPSYTAPLQFASAKTVKFRSWDTAGNVEAMKTATVQVDTVTPTIAITSPANRAKASGNVVIKTNAADTGGSGVASVSFYVDGTTLIGTDTTPPWQINWSTKNVKKGSHVLTAVATDAAGNKKISAPITVTVN